MISWTDPTRRARSHAVDGVELVGHLAELLGVDRPRHLAQPRPQARLLVARGRRHLRLQLLHPRVRRRALLHLAREDDRRRRRAADDRGVGALERDHREVVVERLREDHERAAVVARDDAEDDRPVGS